MAIGKPAAAPAARMADPEQKATVTEKSLKAADLVLLSMETEKEVEPEDSKNRNPLVQFLHFLASFMIPGMGMFAEAYFVFAVGNLSNIWKVQYFDCWKAHTTCDAKLSDSITYTQVCGIIFGQIFLGFFADRLGRKWGSVITAATMCVGGILIVVSNGPTDRALWAMFTAVQFIFGIGVGGEYPVASTSANERAEGSQKLQKRRGETVVLVFSMQGWGNLVNTAVILAIMAGFHQYGAPYDNYALDVTWRLSYALGLVPLFAILFYRIFRLRESAVWVKKREALESLGGEVNRGVQWLKWKKLMWYYWHRNFGTSMSWFVWDFAFYGNKLFQSTFIKIINPSAGLIEVLEWTLLNSAVALVGYYCAAATVDKPWMGRMRMQMMGFAWMFVLFTICAAQYTALSTPKWIHTFQFLYYFSSFWGQFGPNATTWLLPAELAPTELRSMCHGFSAAVGKAGALVAGVVFNLVDNRTKFWISGFCGLAGVVLTWLTIPDSTGLDLKEGDRRWLAILDNHHDAYCGEAVNPKHLSVWERYVCRYGSAYAPPEGNTPSAGSVVMDEHVLNDEGDKVPAAPEPVVGVAVANPAAAATAPQP